MKLLFLILLFAPVALADDWEDFTNNLATDLAPLITLFGEQLTKQFLSESISYLDNIIFALSPLGVLTAVVSLIRVCGSSSLKAFIGRAQEGPAEAESELLPCVSGSTAELFNDGGISRVFGRPKILEIVAVEEKDSATGESSVELQTLRGVLGSDAWKIKGSSQNTHPDDLLEGPELDTPNLSLNKGIRRRDQFWFYCVAVVGAILQIGVIIYAVVTVYIVPGSFKVDGKAVPKYAFPLYIIGTVFLFMGMMNSAILIGRSSHNYTLVPNKPSKVYWLQPGNQVVGDQVFNAFLAVNAEPLDSMSYIKSRRGRLGKNQSIETYATISLTMVGFIFQFIGREGCIAQ
ncbi:hypothetical protein N7470_005332 [Penicillium chermesinum]|nr:hypothetical protein N7470_005332 [Penicillium chermesinum]